MIPMGLLPTVRVATPVVHSLPASAFPQLFWQSASSRWFIPFWRTIRTWKAATPRRSPRPYPTDSTVWAQHLVGS